MDHFRLFREISADPHGYAVQWKKKYGAKVIGHFCSYAPQELILAAGALPFRILSSGAEIAHADAFLQAYCCSLARSGLEDALSGRLSFLDGAVFPHTCDTIMRLSDVWRLNAGLAFHADIILPVKLDTESAAEYMQAVLGRFQADLEKGLGVTITEEKLRAAIRVCNRVRRSLEQLYELRRQMPEAVRGSDLHALFKAAMVMDRAELADELANLTAVLQNHPGGQSPAAKRLVLSGGLCSMPDIYQVLEESGAKVVWDDFCTGSRYFEGRVDEAGDPLRALSERYRRRVVCPAKHSGLYERGRYLVQKARETQADGVIFVYLKFCDPHAFDYPYLKQMLDEEKIPSLIFEIEDQLSSAGQLRTRCEAFMEML